MPRATRAKKEVNYDEDDIKDTKPVNGVTKPRKTEKPTPKKAAPKRKAETEADEGESEETGKPAKTAAKKRKTKTQQEDAMPLAERTAIPSLGKAMYIGAHVSAAGGVQNALTNATHIGANSFALFLKSQRKWDNPPLTDEVRDLFHSACKSHSYSAGEHALPHGSYLVNLAQADETKAAQAYKSFVDDLKRCDELGIKLYNFHPGSTGGDTKEAACGRIAKQLNRSHKETKEVVTVLENMAGSGNVVGSTWEDLRDIIALVEDKDRVGVCIDTCHAFAAGFDLRTPEAFKKSIDSFNDTVGEQYLKAFHVNDSKAPLGSNRDLHANIGTGFLGLRAFHSLMNTPSFHSKPMILETPIDKKNEKGKAIEDKQVWADEIKLLESLIGMDPESDHFKKLEKELREKGKDERERIQAQVDAKANKAAPKKKGTIKKMFKKMNGEESESE